MDSSEVRRAAPDSPTRCQAVTSHGQCRLEAVPGGKNCAAHGGVVQAKVMSKSNVRLYQIAKFQSELDRHADHSHIKSLRDEIGILRMTLEMQINKCNDATDLLLNSAMISDLVSRIEKLVVSCHKIEQSTGALLDKQAVITFAQQVVNLIATVLQGQEDTIVEIADGIMDILRRLESGESMQVKATAPSQSKSIASEAEALEDEE